MRTRIVAAVGVVAAVALLAAIIPTATGVIVALGSIVVFGWAVVGLVVPHKVGLPGRWHAVGLLPVAIIMLAVGGALQSPSQERASLPTERVSAVEAAATEEPEQSPVSGVTFREIRNLFGPRSDMTELQKGRLWDETYDGLCVEWRGELTSLDDGLFSGFVAQFRHLPTTIISDVVMTAPNSAEDELMTWRIGTRYTYRATLDSYGALMGISASMGCD